MKRPDYIPDDPEIAVVESSDELFSRRRARHETMILLPRPIKGCFNDLAIWLLKQNPERDTLVSSKQSFMTTIYRVEHLDVFAKDHCMDWPDELALIRADMRLMQERTGVTAELRVVRDRGYHPETYEFHQDGGNYRPRLHDSDRTMCAYNGPVTECLLTANAVQVPGYTQDLNKFYKKHGAPAFQPGIGDIWRQTCMDGGQALIHRAVHIPPGNLLHPWKGARPWNPPRLLAVC